MITNAYDPAAVRGAHDGGVLSLSKGTAARMPRLETDRVFLYRPEKKWTFSHHPHITFFEGRFHVIWSNGRRDEDAPGQRVLLSTSRDSAVWTEPAVLAEPRGNRVLTAAGFHQHDGMLVAYFCDYGPGKENTGLFAVTTTDGEAWSAARDMGIPVCPNHGPQRTASGRLIISGNISYPYTDDPSGLSGWRMSGIYPPDMAGTSDDPASFWRVQERMSWPAGLCEGSFYQTDDGVIRMMLRSTGKGFSGRLWVTESRDDGETWSGPTETRFSDNNTKFHFGRLPDGRFYYVGCPDPEPPGARYRLVLATSTDGITFGNHRIVADEHYERKAAGRAKHGDYGYPHTMIHDGDMYVVVSRQKEAVEVISAPLDGI